MDCKKCGNFKPVKKVKYVESFVGNPISFVKSDSGGNFILALCMIPLLGTVIITIYFLVREKEWRKK